MTNIEWNLIESYYLQDFNTPTQECINNIQYQSGLNISVDIIVRVWEETHLDRMLTLFKNINSENQVELYIGYPHSSFSLVTHTVVNLAPLPPPPSPPPSPPPLLPPPASPPFPPYPPSLPPYMPPPPACEYRSTWPFISARVIEESICY